jgi:hypothetical protein
VLSLADVCKLMISVEVDKKFQRFDWMTRPIPGEAIEYAAKDSLLVLKIWNQLKVEYDMNLVDLSWSKRVTSCIYDFPKVKVSQVRVDFELMLSNFSRSFASMTQSVKSDLFKLFRERYDLFERLWYCRLECAKIIDCRPVATLNIYELGKVFRYLPLNVEYFFKFVPKSRAWDISVSQLVVSCIKDYVKSVEDDKVSIQDEKESDDDWELTPVESIKEVETWEVACRPSTSNNEGTWEVATRPSSPNEKESLESDMSTSSSSSSPSQSPTISLKSLESSLPVPERDDDTAGPSKKEKNYLKKLYNKNRLKQENSFRLKSGLAVISKSKNCGKKKRERSKLRREKRYFMGPTSIPVGGFQSRRECKGVDYSLR